MQVLVNHIGVDQVRGSQTMLGDQMVLEVSEGVSENVVEVDRFVELD